MENNRESIFTNESSPSLSILDENVREDYVKAFCNSNKNYEKYRYDRVVNYKNCNFLFYCLIINLQNQKGKQSIHIYKDIIYFYLDSETSSSSSSSSSSRYASIH